MVDYLFVYILLEIVINKLYHSLNRRTSLVMYYTKYYVYIYNFSLLFFFHLSNYFPILIYTLMWFEVTVLNKNPIGMELNIKIYKVCSK